MKISNYEIFEIHAEFCKTLANPKRLIIIKLLAEGEKTVSDLAEILDSPIANVSQHLKALRDQYIVSTRKDGQKVFYSLTDPRLFGACNNIRNLIIDLNKKKGKIIGGEDDFEVVKSK